MKKKNAFTLVEILIVMAIIIILALMMIGIFASTSILNKGKDSQRKKDLNRIKIAFEEYFNDKNCYPQDVSDWNKKENCNNSSVFLPYLSSWPCDPNGEPYLIIVDSCNKFRVITNLENKNDEDIPEGWYEKENLYFLGRTVDDVNYGVSSSNINWYEENYVPSYCIKEENYCFIVTDPELDDGCRAVDSCSYEKNEMNCYYGSSNPEIENGKCDKGCRTPCCGPGCIFN